MRLAGKVALVTGTQQGIGRAIAVALARDGADVGEEIAGVAVFLASVEACWITGELIHVNGGFNMA